jgi:GR25 family glycosyltransferase involved in LPS biosynthesis
MKVIVLSLSSAKERREYMTQVLSTQNIEFEFFDSLSPNDIDKELIDTRPHYFSPEGVATFETHRKAIGHAKDQNDFILVLEDDATPNYENVLDKLKKLLSEDIEFDLLFVGYLSTLGIKSTKNPSFVKIKEFIGFHSYIVNPKSVDKILNVLGEPKEHVDKVVSKMIKEGKINGLFTNVSFFKQVKKLFKSQIPKKIDILRNERK